jgi:TetR/AcrR family transcriptional repressor of nem operon
VSKSERTRTFIIESTAPLFNTRGYDGTSLYDLCKATGLTKGALYGNFKNKDDLFLAAFQFAIKRMQTEGKEHMSVAGTFKEKLKALLGFFSRYVLDPPVRGGCPLLNNAVDADDHRPRMKKVISRELEKQVEYITSLLDGGRAEGEFKANFDSREIALFCFCAIEGAIMYSRVSSSEEAMKAVTGNLGRLIDSLC